MKTYYQSEVHRTSQDVIACMGDLKIALLADSHLDNSVQDTVENINVVDNTVRFDCCIHLGDFLAGTIGKRYADMLLRQQLNAFRDTVSCGKFYPVQGNHDEFDGRCTEQFWSEKLSFLKEDKDVHRAEPKPYYYVDFDEKKIRLVFLCSYFYKYTSDVPSIVFGLEERQISWMRDNALMVPEDWTILIFSHDAPFSDYNEETAMADNQIVNGNLAVETVHQCQEERGFSLAGWFIGHHHGDFIKKICGIQLIAIGSQTAYFPQLMGKKVHCWERTLGTQSEDLWDALVVKKDERRIYLKRFGAGNDRTIEY